MNLAAVIDPHPDDAVALIDRDQPTTYGALREQVGQLRGALVELGLAPGDRVGIICGNDSYFVTSYLAVLGAGLVAVPLNPLSPARELQRELAAVGVRAVIVGPAGQPSMSGIDPAEVPALEHRIVAEDLPSAEPVPIVERDASDLAVLIFTSGTAGSPKAAMLTHGNLLANLEQMQAHPGRAQNALDVSLGVLPLFHIFGLNVVLGLSLYAGSRRGGRTVRSDLGPQSDQPARRDDPAGSARDVDGVGGVAGGDPRSIRHRALGRVGRSQAVARGRRTV